MKNFIKVLDKPIFTVLICSLLYGLFVSLFLVKNNFNYTSFINIGSNFVQKKQEKKIIVIKDSYGYDGQFYYSLAGNPLTNKQVNYGIELDNPIYRQQRILYPFLVWLITFNHLRSIPIILVIVNVLLLGAIAYYGSLYAISVRKHSLWGLTFALYAGFLFTLSKDLTEITAIAFLLMGITHLKFKQYLVSGILFSLAILAKETTFIVSPMICFVLIFSGFKNKKLEEFIAGALPIVVYILWHIWLYFHWLIEGQTDSLGIGNNIGTPFVGIFEFVKSIKFASSIMKITSGLELTFFIVFIFLVMISIYKTRAPLYITLSWFFYFFLAIHLSISVWVGDGSFMRALSELIILGIIILLDTDNKTRYFILSGLGLWFHIAINLLRFG